MDAETAAAPGVTDATESTIASTTSDTPPAGGSEDVQQPDNADLMTELGIPEEVQEIVEPKEKPNNGKENKGEKSHEEKGDEEQGEKVTDQTQGSEGAAPGTELQEKVQKGEGVEETPGAAAAVTTAAAATADPDEQVSDKEKKEWPEEALGRIHKLARQKREAREEAAGLREQLQNATQVRLAPSKENPLSDVVTWKDLADTETAYENLLEWCDKNPDGVSDVAEIDPATMKPKVDANGDQVTRDYSRAEIIEMRATSSRILRKDIPMRAQYIEVRSKNDKAARELYPDMFKEGTDDHKAFVATRRILPGIETLLDPDLTVARYLTGLKAELAAKGKNGKTVSEELAPFLKKRAKSAPPAVTTRTGTETVRAKSDQAKVVEKFAEDGAGDAAIEKMIEDIEARTQPSGALV